MKNSTTDFTEMHATVPYAQPFACLPKDSVQAYPELSGETLLCTSGHLWVTVEGDGVDHILLPGESLAIPGTGKVVIGGPGCYQISPGTLDLRHAS